MGILGYLYSAANSKVELSNGESTLSAESTSIVVVTSASVTEDVALSIEQPREVVEPTASQPKARRFSFPSLNFPRKEPQQHKPALTAIQDHEKRELATQASAKRAQKAQQLSRSDKRAKQSALEIRGIIVGPTSAASPKLTSESAKPQLNKLKTQLLQPKTANQLILHLRQLPANGDLTDGHNNNGPIHAVCLLRPDEEEHDIHFSKLTAPAVSGDVSTQNFNFPGIVSAPLDAISNAFHEMKLVDLVNTPDLGLGQPGDGNGILAGAIPTAETVFNGITKLSPDIMALGYATGRVIAPDHSGIHPPTDRMSVLTYWWGFELLLPPPSLKFLGKVDSVSGAVINFLSAVALIDSGVREILPFIRYIAQFVDFEFQTIKKQDRGEGVVCAATWLIPAALIPRPWDFPPSPNASLQAISEEVEPAPAVLGHILSPEQSQPIKSDETLLVSPAV